MRVGVVIPAHDEEECVALSVANCRTALTAAGELRIVVCDNASSDRTASCARDAGAEVVREDRRGYGAACLAALKHLDDWPDVILFCDADATTSASDIAKVGAAMSDERIDLCIGARRNAEPGSMSLAQRFGNRLSTLLIRWLWGHRYFDLGPTRAIRRRALEQIDMCDTTWGWTVEMQIKAVVKGLNVLEIPVAWLARPGGKSKIGGTFSGVLRAGFKILWTVGTLFAATKLARARTVGAARRTELERL